MTDDFRNKQVTLIHAVSRSNSKKTVADFSFTDTLPVWAAVQACWALGANNWDGTDKDDDIDNAGLFIGDADADVFWQLVNQFGG